PPPASVRRPPTSVPATGWGSYSASSGACAAPGCANSPTARSARSWRSGGAPGLLPPSGDSADRATCPMHLDRCPVREGGQAMTEVDITIIDQAISDGHKRELATRLSDALGSADRDGGRHREPGGRTRWIVIAEAVRLAAVPDRGPDRRVATLDYAAWHAHLAGTRPWVAGRDSATTPSRLDHAGRAHERAPRDAT